MERIEKLQQFLKDSPGDSFLQHALALEYIKVGNDVAARRQFEELLAREPSYTGSYYHLAKLLERNNDTSGAIRVYEKGMAEAKKTGEMHTYGELRSAYEELTL